MSIETYEKLYSEATDLLNEALQNDEVLSSGPPIVNRPEAIKQLSKQYIRYILIVNHLGTVYDQHNEFLKLQVMRKVLDCAVGRLLELKYELSREEYSDFIYLDDSLIEMKLTRRDIELKVPPYYLIERRDILRKWNEQIDEIITRRDMETGEMMDMALDNQSEIAENPDTNRNSGSGQILPLLAEKKKKMQSDTFLQQIINKKPELTPEQKTFQSIISLIQRHERARQARLVARINWENAVLKHQLAWHTYVPIEPDVLLEATLNIQRFWRGYRDRVRIREKDVKLRLLIDELRKSQYSTPQKWRKEEILELGRIRQKEWVTRWINQYQKRDYMVRSDEAFVDITKELKFFIWYWFQIVNKVALYPHEYVIPPPGLIGLLAGLPDAFMEKYNVSQVKPPYPPHLLSVPVIILGGFIITPELFSFAAEAAFTIKHLMLEEEKREKYKPLPPPKLTIEEMKLMKQQAKIEAKEKREKMLTTIAEKRNQGVYTCEPKHLEQMIHDMLEAVGVWSITLPFLEKVDGEVMKNIMSDLRSMVDDVILEEMDRLQFSAFTDRGKKPLDFMKDKKKPKPKKKRVKRDPTKDRTFDSLFEELVLKNVIKKYDFINIDDDLILDYAYCNMELRGDPYFGDPFSRSGDLKQVLKEYCILNVMAPRPPVDRSVIPPRGHFPPPIRSVLLMGPPNCCKKTLVNAVCSQLGAVKFDLSPPNLRGHFKSKKEVGMLVHLVSKMSRMMQPSVIFIDGAHKPFYKRVPRSEKDDNPRMLRSKLMKLVKEINGENDRVLFLATSDYPWQGNPDKLSKMYDKILPVFRPDYGTLYMYWWNKLMQFHGLSRDFPLSPLCQMSQYFPIYIVDEAISTILTPERIVKLKPKPLDPLEFYDFFLSRAQIKVNNLKEEMYINWYKTNYPMAEKRLQKLVSDQILREKLSALEEKKKGRK
ncbi:IQ and AAA domain-containing protein 1-like [Nilaparvata lugens]|uniref:IQ and AAA domain-containing protein 1-like n=1 Tax=Nilaparvata lugens TaxID=108931 RepID=UPI00193E9EB2|nr:IQ and AAA domain-containing protein 1-like [Nilaparvata lugens]